MVLAPSISRKQEPDDSSYGFAIHGKEAPTRFTKRHQEHQGIQFLKVQVLVSLVLFLVNLVGVLLSSF